MQLKCCFFLNELLHKTISESLVLLFLKSQPYLLELKKKHSKSNLEVTYCE